MYSIYKFFDSLLDTKEKFLKVKKLDLFPFNNELLSCRNNGIFPDLAIKINSQPSDLTGGELIELKDSVTYSISSFNSTIPSGKKEIAQVIQGENSIIKTQMENAGDDIYALPVRDVYYLIRGRRKTKVKVCLVYGSFFETTPIENLISQSFGQVLEERLKQSDVYLTDELKKTLTSLFSQQENFSKVRNVEKASVKLRFRIMTEVKKEGNLLNAKLYPEIVDNTINFVLPCYTDIERENYHRIVERELKIKNCKSLKTFLIKHPLNGSYLQKLCK